MQMGYGARALESLNSFYSGELYNFDDAPTDLGESFADAAQVAPVRHLLLGIVNTDHLGHITPIRQRRRT
jgi:N-acetyltransferase 10